ncbi:MAG: hypothetical protein VB100_10495 [Angelakisella sp.]|nr:hypothetical protein [Angelakisella sp.]
MKPLAAKNYAMRYGLTVYVDEFREMELSGRVFSPVEGLKNFGGILEMLNHLENICNQIDYPQNTHRMRSFVTDKKQEQPHPMTLEEARSVEEIEKKENQSARGTAATFVVQVRYRQNATWQGSVKWVDTGKSQNFRSTLELINLMEGALQSTQDATTKSEWNQEE